MLSLASATDRCDLLPDIGGCIGSWIVRGQPLLRAAGAAAIARRDPLGTASFPLLPYSNRIGDGRFSWNGARVELERNFAPEPHAVHGVGYRRRWHVLERTAESATLGLVHRPDLAWPWPFEAQQTIRIADGSLTLALSAINRADHPAPLAFGHHPYIPMAGAHLSFVARRVWLSGIDQLPAESVAPAAELDFSVPKSVETVSVDHCYTGWDGRARVHWAGRPLALEIEASRSLPAAVVYVRRGAEAFCFEPVPHLSNALNRPDAEPAMPVIASGGTFHATIRFRAVAQKHG